MFADRFIVAKLTNHESSCITYSTKKPSRKHISVEKDRGLNADLEITFDDLMDFKV
jgi:hypothetical protein